MSSLVSTPEATARKIHVEALARVEGEGGLDLELRDGQVAEVRFRIFEPPRFFEAFLRGRSFQEVPDFVARICGICPVAYQMSACHALERAQGVFEQIDPHIRELRNLLYCGEWIESHMLHMFMLNLPDFLGYDSALTMAADHRDVVRRALRIKRAGNEIVALLGGRSVHPVNACVGGFYGEADPRRAAELAPEVRQCLDDMCELTLWLAENVKFPHMECDYEFVSLCGEHEYPMNLGRIKSNKGLDVEQEEFRNVIEEHQSPHSTALHSVMRGRGPYFLGPLARLNLNAGKLHPKAGELFAKVCSSVGPLPWNNCYLSIMARAMEVTHALASAADMLENYRRPARSRIPITPRAGMGGHGTEAPRGLCWHCYVTEADGTVTEARIIPPTSQNQGIIESDLRALASEISDLPDDKLAQRCEHLVRNYDPCISCSTHFVRIKR
jgi:sulfhydrogenase subunit alpha